MKDLKHIKRFNESEENLNISDVSGSLPLPKDAHSLEVFAIKDCKESPTGKEAYIGYKLKTGCFHFISVPYTGNDR
ncbi:hypothetical protein EBS02_02840 [bacterium]|jgi:hypothetical protein|nr:hypothetical protein [bacterium]